MTQAEVQREPVGDVIAGLQQPIKHLPCRLLYDARGAELFERITEVDEYYLTRSEHALLEESLPAIVQAVGPNARVIEPGSGSGRKTRMLLAALRPSSYIPIDIAEEQLIAYATALRDEHPGLEVQPVLADYMRKVTLPESCADGRTLVFFPGSTIGNFEPDEARRFLSSLATVGGDDALLLLGADSNANRDELIRAYDDREGVTAEFDLNILAHLNATHGANFDLDQFMHRSVWNAARSRIEMHLVSRRAQVVEVAGRTFTFARGEYIVTEHCYKHTPAALEAILRDSGWSVSRSFVDPAQRMRLWLSARRPIAQPLRAGG